MKKFPSLFTKDYHPIASDLKYSAYGKKTYKFFSGKIKHNWLGYISRKDAVQKMKKYKITLDKTDHQVFLNDHVKIEKSKFANKQQEENTKTYLGYVKNRKGSIGLFTRDKNIDTQWDLAQIRKSQIKAAKKKSIFWNLVISFDTKYSVERGIWENDFIKDSLQQTFDSFLEGQNLKKENTSWVGGIHTNTDNIHVHIAVWEKTPTRKKRRFLEVNQNKGLDYYRKETLYQSIEIKHFISLEMVKNQSLQNKTLMENYEHEFMKNINKNNDDVWDDKNGFTFSASTTNEGNALFSNKNNQNFSGSVFVREGGVLKNKISNYSKINVKGYWNNKTSDLIDLEFTRYQKVFQNKQMAKQVYMAHNDYTTYPKKSYYQDKKGEVKTKGKICDIRSQQGLIKEYMETYNKQKKQAIRKKLRRSYFDLNKLVHNHMQYRKQLVKERLHILKSIENNRRMERGQEYDLSHIK